MERNYIFSPASRYNDNPTFEFFLIHRETNKWAAVQVKTGNVRLRPIEYARDNLIVFLFSPAGYEGDPGSCARQ